MQTIGQITAIRTHVELGQGLLGQAAAERQRLLITEMPPEAVPIGSSLFSALPRAVVVLPVLYENQLKAVIELASLTPFTDSRLVFLDQLTASIGIVLNTIEATMQTESFLKQSQQLAGELQTQQHELQQTNEQLAQKAQQLAEQNVEVERKNAEIEQARRALEEKAAELALTSKYKSEFLANMSHELRTPLNSILILAQQLADNHEQNLTSRRSSSRARSTAPARICCMLISDILDLSKIESGIVTVDAQEVFVTSLLDMVSRPFRHEAETRGLLFDRRHRSVAHRSSVTDVQAPAAGAQEPAVECVQVHGAGRRRLKLSLARRRMDTRSPGSQPGQFGRGLRSLRHRHRHCRRQAAHCVRSVSAGRREHEPEIWRHGPWPGDQPRAGEPARR